MSIFEIIFWIVVVFLGGYFLKFLIVIAIAFYLLKKEELELKKEEFKEDK
ncbi:hypothetical protein [Dolosigranulum pigrum]|jgi:hypothetical protein|nr:hypothetical protein [Dolosigranulum pigrum]